MPKKKKKKCFCGFLCGYHRPKQMAPIKLCIKILSKNLFLHVLYTRTLSLSLTFLFKKFQKHLGSI